VALEYIQRQEIEIVADPNAKLLLYLDATAATFPLTDANKVRQALGMIGDPPCLQLLALRRYIRKAKSLDAQWAWDRDQVWKFEHGAESTAVRADIDRVQSAFARLNPGYALGVSPIRSLARQVAKFKANATVRKAAAGLEQRCLEVLDDYPDSPDPARTLQFRSYLGQCPVSPEPSSAAPGLSDHGQMHAIDFVVLRTPGQKLIAGTSTATIRDAWDIPGWTDKLRAAVRSAGDVFDGPLKSPREPWHYTRRR
jgi:hypothetical protein